MPDSTWNPDLKATDAEIATLITNSLGTPDDGYPSRQLSVSNEFIKNHPEFEAHRVEVYVAYVRVYCRMKEEGKLATPPAGSPSILVRKPPSATPLKRFIENISPEKFEKLLQEPHSMKKIPRADR